jgi:hypothetical protein
LGFIPFKQIDAGFLSHAEEASGFTLGNCPAILWRWMFEERDSPLYIVFGMIVAAKLPLLTSVGTVIVASLMVVEVRGRIEGAAFSEG